ncbi:sugar phosphate isomerase/epimerase [Dehalococcoidia bacterium]|nr:sugar phosphate isomerase/epimerase [Dehalococcoidia bacterium]
MKVSIVVPLQYPTPLSPLSPEKGLEANLARVAEAGYDGVELAIADPASINMGEIEQLLERYNLEMPAITTGQAYGIEGLSLTGPAEETRRKAIRRIKDHIKIARNLGATVIIGLIRGESGGEEAEKLLIGALQECAAVDPTVRLVLEPLNRYETQLVNNVDEALEILDRVGAENVGILFDTFHANIEEVSIEWSIRRAARRIFHVHVADSNRWAPGYGHLDFKSILSALQEVHYNGFLSAEILAKPTPAESLNKAVYLREVKDERTVSEVS